MLQIKRLAFYFEITSAKIGFSFLTAFLICFLSNAV